MFDPLSAGTAAVERPTPLEPAFPSPSPALAERRDPTGRPRRPRGIPLVLPPAPAIYPWLAQRLVPGEATVLSGPERALTPLLEALYAGVVAAGGRVSLLEGANRFHPYRLGERGRALGLDPERLLERIRLARAFTAYQLVRLVEQWSAEVRRERPALLVAHDLPALFWTDELPEEERAPLLGHVAGCLAGLASTSGRPLVLAGPTLVRRFPGLGERGPRWAEYLSVSAPPGRLVLASLRDALRLTLVQRPSGQTGLDDFAPPDPKEVIAWGGQCPPTARRSRSG